VAGPVKRSMMIAGHATSISLEPIFWEALREAAEAEGLPLNALVARIDAERIEEPAPANLASAIRVWLFDRRPGGGRERRKPAKLVQSGPD
jgi:predicted DNA-binding ribbon-helix-helix protein